MKCDFFDKLCECTVEFVDGLLTVLSKYDQKFQQNEDLTNLKVGDDVFIDIKKGTSTYNIEYLQNFKAHVAEKMQNIQGPTEASLDTPSQTTTEIQLRSIYDIMVKNLLLLIQHNVVDNNIILETSMMEKVLAKRIEFSIEYFDAIFAVRMHLSTGNIQEVKKELEACNINVEQYLFFYKKMKQLEDVTRLLEQNTRIDKIESKIKLQEKEQLIRQKADELNQLSSDKLEEMRQKYPEMTQDVPITLENAAAMKANMGSLCQNYPLIKLKSDVASFDKDVSNIKEDVYGTVRVYVKMRGGLKSSSKVYDIVDATTPSKVLFKSDGSENICKQQEKCASFKKVKTSSNKTFGNFFDVFHAKKNNNDTFETMRGLFDQVVEDGYTTVFFGYGYSGSGKTHVLLNEDLQRDGYGLVLQAIQYYIDKDPSIVIELKEVNELFVNLPEFTFTTEYVRLSGKLVPVYSKDSTKTVVGGNILREVLKSDENNIEIQRICNEFNQKPSVDAMVKIAGDLNKIRRDAGRIKATINNPDSSRSHLFLHLSIKKGGQHGNIILCDMAGSEDPLEILNKSSVKVEGNDILLKSVIPLGAQSLYLSYDHMTKSGERLRNHDNFKTFFKKYSVAKPQVVNDTFKEDVVAKSMSVLNTSIEGMFINETLNHIKWYFNFLNGRTYPTILWGRYVDQSQIYSKHFNDKEKYTDTKFYKSPADEFKDVLSVEQKKHQCNIGIIPYLEQIRRQGGENKTKFVMIACVKTDDLENDEKTLMFAQDVSSANNQTQT
jgi:hypothetical protein